MMGVPDGWICGESTEQWNLRMARRGAGLDQRPVGMRGSLRRRTIDITRNEALKAAGNGVVPQQAIAALQDMLNASQRRAA